jgi:hypothetical protein
MYASDETLEHEAAMQEVAINVEEDGLWLDVLALRVEPSGLIDAYLRRGSYLFDGLISHNTFVVSNL